MLLLNELLDTNRHDTFLTVRSVVGHDDHLIRRLAHLVLEDDKILRTTSHHAEDTVTCSLQSLDDRQHGRNTQTATSTDNSAVVLDLRRIAKWAYYVSYVVADLKFTKFHG